MHGPRARLGTEVNLMTRNRNVAEHDNGYGSIDDNTVKHLFCGVGKNSGASNDLGGPALDAMKKATIPTIS